MSNASRCVLWGMGVDYERLINQVLFEICKGNIAVEAVVCREEDIYCSARDGFPVISKRELGVHDIDYVIVTSSAYFKEIKKEAIELGIEEKRIINGIVFHRQFFDFERYRKLIENPVTILSDDCWGGNVYHYLCLPFTSPLVNIFWEREEYARFIQEPMFYLNTELEMVEKGDLDSGIRPVGSLGCGDKKVRMRFIHSIDFEFAKKEWNRRVQRINSDNLFVKFGFDTITPQKDVLLDAFKLVQYNKVLFYGGEENIENKFKAKRYLWENRNGFVQWFNYGDYAREKYLSSIDIFKLLTGDKNWCRER